MQKQYNKLYIAPTAHKCSYTQYSKEGAERAHHVQPLLFVV